MLETYEQITRDITEKMSHRLLLGMLQSGAAARRARGVVREVLKASRATRTKSSTNVGDRHFSASPLSGALSRRTTNGVTST
jgi:hypothetical protein